MNKLKTLITAFVVMAALQMTAGAADLSDWAVNEYIESNATGLLSYRIASNDLRSNITREEFCELAMNLYAKLTNETMRVPDESPFSDCNNVAVSQAYYNGIVSGVADNTFAPNQSVTRQEMAKMLVNTLNASEVNVSLNTENGVEDIQNFSDYANVSEWARSAVSTMVNNDLLSGNIDNQIMPQSNATREQAITCVNRCYKTFSQSNAQQYMLPVVESPEAASSITGDFKIQWSPVNGATSYYVIIKDANGKTVFNTEAQANATIQNVLSSELASGNYSVVIGAAMESGDCVFSVPVDFAKSAPFVAATPAPTVTTTPAPNYSNESVSPKAQQVLNEAAKYLGIAYVYGGTTPAGFDCSGFVQYVYRNCGVSLDRVSRDQYAKDGTYVEKSNLQPGDLVFFGTSGSVSHVGLYVGGGMMIHSPSTGKSIMYTSIESKYYTSRYIGAKRVI